MEILSLSRKSDAHLVKEFMQTPICGEGDKIRVYRHGFGEETKRQQQINQIGEMMCAVTVILFVNGPREKVSI